MRDIAAWLAEIGLAKHGDTFRANAIDFDVLSALEENDLKELGLPLGDRKRLLRAISALGKSGNEALPSAASPERRQLTVLFADLVGSTALSQALDPEDLRDVMLGYHEAVAAAIRDGGGFVAKFMGDGVLAYFGYPQATEDAAERAVRASLRALDVVRALPSPGGGVPSPRRWVSPRDRSWSAMSWATISPARSTSWAKRPTSPPASWDLAHPIAW